MPPCLAVGNWKMNTGVAEAVALASSIRNGLESPAPRGVETVICPPFISLAPVMDAISGSPIKLGAQNAYSRPSGAFTGEISPQMLADFCQYVILGHSERRHVMGEDEGLIAEKTVAAVAAGLQPILCVGETLEERQRGDAGAVTRRQIRTALAGVPTAGGLVIAYEPVWAIGTGVPATPAAVVDITAGAIREELADRYGETASSQVPVLYGGSVNPQNVADFLREPSIQGALVGGASLNAGQFIQIVRLTAEIKGPA